MAKKGIIYDLDNTIYPVHSIADRLFADLFQMILENGEHARNMESIKNDMMRKPFQVVAAKYHFSDALAQKGLELLRNLTYHGVIEPFSDYPEIKKLPAERYLVTTGFFHLQQSKIKQLGIEQDFKEIHIVDPATTDKTKKDIFKSIMQRNGYTASEVLVVGDDPESEIKAAKELSMDAVLYDKFQIHTATALLPTITNFKQLIDFIK